MTPYKSDWTKEQFDALNKGDYSNPSNGTKLEGILKDPSFIAICD
ncbi:MAG: hypothetical protein ACLTM7_04725 [Streptococcus sp.]